MKKVILLIAALVLVAGVTAGTVFAVKKARQKREMEVTDETGITEIDTAVSRSDEPVSEEVQTEKDISSSLDASEIHMINVFLSNFSEHKIDKITNKDDAEIIRFIMLNLRFNYYDKFSNDYSATFDGVAYNLSISEEYLQERAKRFFDTEVENQSVDYIKYYNNRYYFPNADGENLFRFSKVTKIFRNEDGSLKVWFSVYETSRFEDFADSGSAVYYGLGSENLTDEKEYGKGTAVLREKYFGENYANYTLVSLNCNPNDSLRDIPQGVTSASSSPNGLTGKSAAWKSAYYGLYKSQNYGEYLIGEPDEAKLGLKDLNNDGIPELLVADPWDSGTYGHGQIYTYSDGSVKYLGASDSYGGQWWPHAVNNSDYPGLFTYYWNRGEGSEGNEMPFHILYYYYDGAELQYIDVASDKETSGEYERITADVKLYNSVINSLDNEEYKLFPVSDVRSMGWDSFCEKYEY